MIRREFILSKLPAYNGNADTVVNDQSVPDIIEYVKRVHKKFAGDYDNIAQYFVDDTPEKTCRNIFDFLRQSAFYFVEGDDLQTLRSPSSIVATGRTRGIDCKNYALFTAGVLDAINRSGLQYIPYCYRFASDSLFDPTPNHVFVVAFPGTDQEMWIDPIPQVAYFNERLLYYYHTDKNFKSMLQVLSGRSNRTVGDWGDTVENAVQGNWVNAATSAIDNIIKAGGPNPEDWKGWPPTGQDARDWVLRDGDSVHNEAVNILKFIKAYGMTPMLTSGAGIPAVTPAQIAAKLTRGGFPAEAQEYLRMGNGTSGSGSGSGAPKPAQAGQNALITFGLIGAGLLLLKKGGQHKVAGSNNTLLLLGAGVAAYFIFHKPAPKPLDLSTVQGTLTPMQQMLLSDALNDPNAQHMYDQGFAPALGGTEGQEYITWVPNNA